MTILMPSVAEAGEAGTTALLIRVAVRKCHEVGQAC
jgi:hypothetical protein